MQKKEYKKFKNVAVSLECKSLLDEIAEKMGLNRGKFLEKLVREAHTELLNK